jgi:hypothetical protein
MMTIAVQEPATASGEEQTTSESAAPAGEVRRAETMPERHRMISEAAYFRAERRGFAAGAELADWLEAEVDIDREMQSGGSRSAHAAAAPV